MKLRRLGFLAALIATFTAGAKLGVNYAKGHYVARDRKFIEGEVVRSKE